MLRVRNPKCQMLVPPGASKVLRKFPLRCLLLNIRPASLNSE